MAIEIERKYLLKNDTWKKDISKSIKIQQAYLNLDIDRTVRVRIKGKKAYLTIKGRNQNTSRQEFEYEIPIEDGRAMLEICHKPFIEKTRHEVIIGNHLWEIDDFFGDNVGLVIAEIELKSEDEKFESPNWLGKEVSGDSKYYNASLIKLPYKSWNKGFQQPLIR